MVTFATFGGVASLAVIDKYFSNLSTLQHEQLAALELLYRSANARANLISRKDIDQLYVRHVLHSMAIARVVRFEAGSTVMDLGTGGGFPGVPLAIYFPEVEFHLVDSIGKKVALVGELTQRLKLCNTVVIHSRAEALSHRYHFVVSRAVASLATLCAWADPRLHANAGGILCLKGGDLRAEVMATGRPCQVYSLSDYFDEPFFETKKLVWVSPP